MKITELRVSIMYHPQCLICSKKLLDIHSRNNVIYFQGLKKKKSIEIDPKMTQILKLADKDFKATNINHSKT